MPVAAAIALASAPGGIDGQLATAWKQLTDPASGTPNNTPDRLTTTSSVRARYWEEAFDIHATTPWVGAGAGAYATARTRFRTGTLAVRHAHGYVPQTLADLGWAGMALSLLALALWAWTAALATGLRLRDRGLPWDAERVGLVTLVAVALVFGVSSAIDWTWFVPANAAAALLAAGWVAGRGSLRSRLRAAPPPTLMTASGGLWSPVSSAAPLADPPALADVAGPGASPIGDADWRRRARFPLPAAGGALLVLALAVAAAWAAYQPVRAVHAGDVAITRLSEGAPDAAADVAGIAHDRNPLSVEPLFQLAAIEEVRGRLAAAEIALEQAIRLQPSSAETWRRLGRFQLSVLSDPEAASSRSARPTSSTRATPPPRPTSSRPAAPRAIPRPRRRRSPSRSRSGARPQRGTIAMHPQRAAAAALDLHREGDDLEAVLGQPAEAGDVLEHGHLRRAEHAVGLEGRRLPAVDARRVDADRLDRALLHQPLRRLRARGRGSGGPRRRRRRGRRSRGSAARSARSARSPCAGGRSCGARCARGGPRTPPDRRR